MSTEKLHREIKKGNGDAVVDILGFMDDDDAPLDLAKVKAAVEAKNKKGQNALHIACSSTQYECLELLLQYVDACSKKFPDFRAKLYSACDSSGLSPMLTAIACNDLDAISALLRNPEQAMQTRNSQNRNTILHEAALVQSEEILNLLLENINDASIKNATNSDGNTPLHLAAYQDISLVHALVSSGAKVNVQNLNGDTPLHCSCVKGDYEIAEYLIKRDADCTVANREQLTVLHEASSSGQSQIVELLLSKFKTTEFVNAKDNEGMTALHYACMNGHTQVVKILLNAHPITDAIPKSKSGLTPLDLALQGEHFNAAELVAEKSGNMEAMEAIKQQKKLTVQSDADTNKMDDKEEEPTKSTKSTTRPSDVLKRKTKKTGKDLDSDNNVNAEEMTEKIRARKAKKEKGIGIRGLALCALGLIAFLIAVSLFASMKQKSVKTSSHTPNNPYN